MTRATPLRLSQVPPPVVRTSGLGTWSDAGLLAFVLAVHTMPLAALAAGHSWGSGVDGYATAVAFVTVRELTRELIEHIRYRAGALPGRRS